MFNFKLSVHCILVIIILCIKLGFLLSSLNIIYTFLLRISYHTNVNVSVVTIMNDCSIFIQGQSEEVNHVLARLSEDACSYYQPGDIENCGFVGTFALVVTSIKSVYMGNVSSLNCLSKNKHFTAASKLI